jgi:carbamoyltransferase
VREDKRTLLGATTHVDGTARVHTVTKTANPLYWDLLDSFRKLTGIPVLLNTSFNNNDEPIVDSVEDAIVCFLTTGLDYLVVGNCLVRKKEADPLAYRQLVVTIPRYAKLVKTLGQAPDFPMRTDFEIAYNFGGKESLSISEDAFELLAISDGQKPASAFAAELGWTDARLLATVPELIHLWTRRAVTLKPST